MTFAGLTVNCVTAAICGKGPQADATLDSTGSISLPKLSIAVGLGLILVGIVGYLYVAAASVTALIPAFIGIVFVILGVVGRNAGARKHAMHAAAALALLTILASARDFGGVFAWAFGDYQPANPVKVVAMTISFLLTLIFLVAAIRSFIAARRNRMAGDVSGEA